MSKPKMSESIRAQEKYVEEKLGDAVICDRCNCTLKTYYKCTAAFCDPCPGFWAIEKHRTAFTLSIARGPR